MKKKVLAIMLVAMSIMLISACGKKEKLYEIPDLSQYKTDYVGDSSNVINIVSGQEYPEGYSYDSIEIQSETEPYGLTVFLKDEPSAVKLEDQLQVNADMAHIVFKALRHGIARADILGDLFEHSARALVAALRGDHLHAAHHAQPRGENDGKLRAEQRQFLVLEPEADGLIQRVPALLHRLDLGDEGTGVAQLGDRLELVVGTDDAGDLRPVDRLALVAVCRHVLSPALRFFPKINTVMFEFYFVIVYDDPIAVNRPRWC